MEEFRVNDKQVLTNVHSRKNCRGVNCTIHNPSLHHLLDWPLYWRSDRRIFERICSHGVGHPDPDNTYVNGDSGIHGCHFFDLEGSYDIMCCSPLAQTLRKLKK